MYFYWHIHPSNPLIKIQTISFLLERLLPFNFQPLQVTQIYFYFHWLALPVLKLPVNLHLLEAIPPRSNPFCFLFWVRLGGRGSAGHAGILAPQPGTELMPPTLGAQSLNHWTAREISICFYFYHCRLACSWNSYKCSHAINSVCVWIRQHFLLIYDLHFHFLRDAFW